MCFHIPVDSVLTVRHVVIDSAQTLYAGVHAFTCVVGSHDAAFLCVFHQLSHLCASGLQYKVAWSTSRPAAHSRTVRVESYQGNKAGLRGLDALRAASSDFITSRPRNSKNVAYVINSLCECMCFLNIRHQFQVFKYVSVYHSVVRLQESMVHVQASNCKCLHMNPAYPAGCRGSLRRQVHNDACQRVVGESCPNFVTIRIGLKGSRTDVSPHSILVHMYT